VTSFDFNLDFDQPKDAKTLTVALVGAPNAGKSTLVNRLVGQKVISNVRFQPIPQYLTMLSVDINCKSQITNNTRAGPRDSDEGLNANSTFHFALAKTSG
jgi:GTPase SAR1 family protein